MNEGTESLLSAQEFAAEIIRNDDEDFPFAHAHGRIVPLARAYMWEKRLRVEMSNLLTETQIDACYARASQSLASEPTG